MEKMVKVGYRLGTNYQHHIRSCADLGRWYLEPQNIEQGITNVEGEQNI